MKPFRSFIPPLAAMLMAASGGASANGVLIDRSEIRFGGKDMGSAVGGTFRKWRASVDFRPKNLAKSKADFEIELGSIDLASEDTEAELRRPVWFDTANFPVARFTSSSMKGLGRDRYEVAGRLSIKGVTRDVVIPIVLTRDAAGNSVAEGRFALNRLDFRIGEGIPVAAGTVAAEVGVRIRMVLPPLV
jgi:polyisoprenoid-binding protein YceI